MRYIVRTTEDHEFNTIEEARKFRDSLPQRTHASLIVHQEDPFGKHFDVNPAAAKPKR